MGNCAKNQVDSLMVRGAMVRPCQNVHIDPHDMPSGALVTIPEPLPVFETFNLTPG